LCACLHAAIPDNMRFNVADFFLQGRGGSAPNSETSEMSSQVNSTKRIVAYFSMEIALENAMPSYSGGLGVLAGDTIRAAADLRLPMVAVSLLYRRGYFTQRLAKTVRRRKSPSIGGFEDFLQEEPARASVSIEDRRVELRLLALHREGRARLRSSVYFLDADLPSNAVSDRNLTGTLYGGDSYYRLCQGSGAGDRGRADPAGSGLQRPDAYHMNEGHAALLSLELLAEEAGRLAVRPSAARTSKKSAESAVFTTHTPVPQVTTASRWNTSRACFQSRRSFWI